MKKNVCLTLLIILCSCNIIAVEEFPYNYIQNIQIVDLWPEDCLTFEEFSKVNLNEIEKDPDKWSSLYPNENLNQLTLTTLASSVLGDKYKSENICDGKIETAWVEGVDGDGIGEWIKISIDAYTVLSEITTTPFEISGIAIIPGYGKSEKTWVENNRVKKLMLVIHTPPKVIPKENEWVVIRLNLKDENKFQIFSIPVELTAANINPMRKIVWLKIEEVYKGTKYEDTCISEFVAFGGFSN